MRMNSQPTTWRCSASAAPRAKRMCFRKWSAGWDAHAAHKCTGLSATTELERKDEFRTRFSHLFRKSGFAAPLPSQRDVMRQIVNLHWPDRERVIEECAAAERRGTTIAQSLQPEPGTVRTPPPGLRLLHMLRLIRLLRLLRMVVILLL